MKVLLDTNVLISAVATRGLCADILRAVLASHELLICPRILDELRKNLRGKFAVPAALVDDYIEFLRQVSAMVESGTAPKLKLMDKGDLAVIAAAVEGRARVLVTGDKELLALKVFSGVRILSPRQFWEEMKTKPLS